MLKWSGFWDSFNSAVHSNPELSEVEKFNYLHSLLEGSAHNTIAGLILSSADYREATEILNKRFGDKQIIISKHKESLLEVEAVESDNNLCGLRQLFDEVESHICSLKALGIVAESYGAILAPVLVNKLPPDVQLIISRKVSSAGPDVDNILKAVKEELMARERMLCHTATSHSHNEKSRTTATTLLTGMFGSSNPTCCYCQHPHPSGNCDKFKSDEAQKQILQSSGRCFNCLGKGYLCRNCPSPIRCSWCKGRHCTSLCESQEHPRGPAQSTTDTASTLDPSAIPFTSTSNNFCTSHTRTVLLQTARAQIYHPPRPQCPVEVCLILDSGSQRFYLSERAQSILSLKPVGEQRLPIATFGSTQERIQACPVVKVGMRVRECTPVHMSLYVVPMICDPLVSQLISFCVSEYPHIASLDLADNSDGTSKLMVDMLIGSDYYWELHGDGWSESWSTRSHSYPYKAGMGAI